jgi:flagellin-like protein
MPWSKDKMKKLVNDPSAVSEVVGALMLVLVVVVAASSFAVFISQQQKIQQDNQLIQDRQAGESILISSLRTNISTDKTYWSSLNITISSLHEGTSEIDRISIDNHVLRTFHVSRYNETTNTYEYIQLNFYQKFIITSQQTVNLNVSISDFFETGLKISTDGPIIIDLYTAYLNSFDKVFYAPTPIININVESQWNSSSKNYEPFLILDGSNSDQPGDTTISRWNWTVDCDGTNYSVQDGRKVRFDPPVTGRYNITLLVENANGMIGISRTTYYH